MAGVAPGTLIARGWVRRYERGAYTRVEAITQLEQAAAEHPPTDLAAGLPADWLEELRERTAAPPASPADVLYISGIMGGPDFDYQAHFARMRQASYEGAWAWHRYFAEPGAAADRRRHNGPGE